MSCERDHTRIFYLLSYPTVFYYLPYSPLIGFLAKIISYITTLTWAFRDLFITNVAFALKLQFSHLNKVIVARKTSQSPADFYSSQRINFRKLSSLVSDVDDSICLITFLSLTVNAFFICVHLFNGLVWELIQKSSIINHYGLFNFSLKGSLLDSIYFWFSFLSLVVRTFAMALTAADLHRETKKPLKALVALSRSDWNYEEVSWWWCFYSIA